MAGQCPKCEKQVTRVKCEGITVDVSGGGWKGISYSCPWCHAILSVAIDPIAIKADIVKDLLKALKSAR